MRRTRFELKEKEFVGVGDLNNHSRRLAGWALRLQKYSLGLTRLTGEPSIIGHLSRLLHLANAQQCAFVHH
jgi:hypothetical protein